MSEIVITPTNIAAQIYFIRGHKVMLDTDLANLYGVETKMLKRAVRRNISRFPADFMFELTDIEALNLRCQIGTSSGTDGKVSSHGGSRYLPFAFTEQGVAMLSGILNSEQAIQVNIQIMRTFVQIRQMLSLNKELTEKLNKLESKYDQQFKVVFDAIKMLISTDDKKIQDKTLGFRIDPKK